jgi:hypothetical protein
LVIKALDPDPDPYWIRIGIQPKMLDPDEMNADPQPWSKYRTPFYHFETNRVPYVLMYDNKNEASIPDKGKLTINIA